VKLRRIALCLILAAGTAPAQTRKTSPRALPASAHKLVAIEVEGSHRYSPQEVIRASGLEPGKAATDSDFKRAVQVLGESGAFSSVSYDFHADPEGTKLKFQLQDSDKFVPARFDNFVWFSDQELQDYLRAHVPLYKGELPVGGDLAQQVSDALQALLIEHKVPGAAEFIRAGEDGGGVQALVFTNEQANVRVHSVSVSGVDLTLQDKLEPASSKLKGAQYSTETLHQLATQQLLPVLTSAGYLRASLGEPEPKVIEQDGDDCVVDVTFPVDLGRQYTLAGIEWAGNKVFGAEKLQSMVHLQAGAVVNRVQLANDLEDVKRLYGSKGYMGVKIDAAPQFDDSGGTVHYRLEVQEGEVYKMGDLDIRGLDRPTSDKIDLAWEMRSGDAYDTTYFKRRFVDQLKDVIDVGEWSVSMQEYPNQNDKTVDVTLHFAKRSR
jgi:outer membrane protein insertion porin family